MERGTEGERESQKKEEEGKREGGRWSKEEKRGEKFLQY